MIDLHCHLLHSIDDGPSDLEGSVMLCDLAAENALETAIATPHLRDLTELPAFLAARDERLDELQKELKDRNIPLRVLPGAEVYASDDLFFCRDLAGASLNGSRYILIEFDFSGLSINRVLRYTDEVFKAGLIPVIAHTERYAFFQEDYESLNFLQDRGVLFQVNALSLAGGGGREEFYLAYEMVISDMASFIATDAHSHRGRPNNMLAMLRSFPPEIKRSTLDYMLNAAPQAVIDNQALPHAVRGEIYRRRR